MAFEDTLARLLAAHEDAIGVLFLDSTGETVHLACAEMSTYDLQVIGAYLGIYMRHLDKVMTLNHLGKTQLIHIEKRQVHIHVLSLPDGYCLALVQRRPGQVARARAGLVAAGTELVRELF
jgi:hypothetical protein